MVKKKVRKVARSPRHKVTGSKIKRPKTSTIWTIPIGIPNRLVTWSGEMSASSTIATLQPVVSPGMTIRPASVRAAIG